MKHKFTFLAMMSMVILMVGCNRNHTTKESENKGDTLSQVLNEATSDITKLQPTEDEKTIDFWNDLSLLLGVIAFVAAIVAIWSTRNHVKFEDIDSKLNRYLRDRGLSEQEVKHLKGRMNSLANSHSQQNPVSSNVGNDNIASLERRIADLERKISLLQQPQKPASQFTPAAPKNIQPKTTKRLYASTNTQEYFTRVVDTKQESCVFVLDLLSPTSTTCEFDIISFDKIKQRNGWQDIVECEGDCMITEATNSVTNQKGKCEKLPDGTWKIVKKLKITISK